MNYSGLGKILADLADGAHKPRALVRYATKTAVPTPADDTQAHNYYVKIRTSDTSCHFEKNKFKERYLEFTTGQSCEEDYPLFCQDFQRTYIAAPFSDNHRLVVIMSNRGTRIEEKLNSSDELKTLMSPMKSYAEEMAEVMFHGDFLPHNFLRDENGTSLCLIDHDEGGIGKRAFEKDAHWSSFLRCPNGLRHNCKEYTEVQFAASLLQLAPQKKGLN